MVMNKNKHMIAILWPHPFLHNHSSVSTTDNLLSMFPTKKWASRLEISLWSETPSQAITQVSLEIQVWENYKQYSV